MSNFLTYLIVFLIGISFIGNYTSDDPRTIPFNGAPRQYNLSKKQADELKYVRKIGDWKILFIPLAYYEISARVLNTNSYYVGIDAVVAPLDIAVGWGKFMEGEEYKKLKTHYGVRTLYFNWSTSENSSYYVKSHVANIHIIPKNKEVLKKVKKIRKGDVIYLRGYLIKAEGVNTQTNESYSRTSSLTRNDTGDGACESMYVTDVIYHHEKASKNSKK